MNAGLNNIYISPNENNKQFLGILCVESDRISAISSSLRIKLRTITR